MTVRPIGKILIVDDEVELKNALVEALARQSFVVQGFTSAREALAALRAEDFDLLLSDLMMPEMNGIDLIKRAHEIDPHLVVIMMTGQGTIQTAVDAMKVGAFDYVLKPFRLTTVMPVLTRAMNTRRLQLENLQLRETVAIYELCQTIAFTLDQQTVISKLADAALQQTDADEVSILLPADDGKELYVAAVRGAGRQRLLGERVPLEQTISGWVASERQPLLLEGEVNDVRFRSLWPHPEIRSSISVPMQVANKLIGTININSLNRVRPFTLGQMKALTILASTAASALESASLYTQVRDAEESYRSIFENAVEGISRSTPKGEFITVNPALARILGYDSPEDLLVQVTNIANQMYVHPDECRRSEEIENSEGVLRGFEFEAYRKDGERIWLSLNRRSVRDANGVVLYHEGSVEDITERRRAEEALRASQQLIAGIINAIPVRVFWKDRNLVYLGCNTILARDAGLTDPDEIIGKDDYQLGWRGQADLWRADDREVIESGCSRLLIEESSTSPEGETITLLTSKIPLRDSTGEISGVIGTYIDITERKRAQAELNRLAAAVEQTADSILITDPKGNIEYVNPAFERITGYSKEEVIGLNPRLLKSGKTDPAAYRELWDTITQGEVWSGQLINRKKDGTLFTERATISAVRDDSERIAHFLAVKQDITHEIQLEEQLRQSQKMEAIGQLAGGVAHDFNNLLTAINGYSSLALQRIDEHHPLRNYLEEIKKAGDRAANLTRQLLAFGRKQILQPLPINLNEVVNDMNKMLRRLIGEDISLIAKLDPVLKKIQADPGQIEQVLVNLVVNARDAMPQGGTLTIETAMIELDEEYAGKRLGTRPGTYVMLAVSDTGTGMDEPTKARIFDPFFTTKEKGKGTGLGLSTVYGIVKQSGGNIWVYSEPGQGTTFKVYLPQIEAVVRQAEKVKAELPIPRGTETVLLVEDEDVVRGLTRQILEQAGYGVVESSRGKEAIRLYAESDQPIDLLLTDVVMPETSGKEVADQLTALKPDLKVLFMSGYTDEAIVHHGVLDPNIEFIQKPFTPAGLARKVREVLDANGSSPKQ